ncbi:MAG: hypothetical protein KJ015_39055 [Myxococcales bacterium]|nr:hypothetical protein [Myxococcales bacterium]
MGRIPARRGAGGQRLQRDRRHTRFTAMIAFYGMGLLGSNFVRALRKRGEEVHVWNRTAARARARWRRSARRPSTTPRTGCAARRAFT